MKKQCHPHISEMLIKAGVQPTLQRLSIARYVIEEADHPTAEEVYTWATQNLAKISQATVYNTLGVLVEAKLIKALKLPHSDKVFYDCNTSDHFHFLDEATGQLYDIDTDLVDVKFKLPKKFKAKSLDLIVQGEIKGEFKTTTKHETKKTTQPLKGE